MAPSLDIDGLQVIDNDGLHMPKALNVVQPGILAPASFSVNGTQSAAAFFADGTYVLPMGAIAGLSSRPAKPGDTIIF
jgi:hypothetical protein